MEEFHEISLKMNLKRYNSKHLYTKEKESNEGFRVMHGI